MAEQLKPDLCGIGAGAGGLAVASAAAAAGKNVVLIEHGKMGGEYLNFGDIPSKSLLTATRRFADLGSRETFGITAGKPAIDFARARAHMAAVARTVRPNVSADRLTGLGVHVIAGSACFTDQDTVKVGDEIVIKAGAFVVATGSSPTSPLINGLETIHYYTTETIFEITECPRHLVIVGGGPAGIELAQAFRRFGAEVTVIEMRRPLASEDAECADLLLEQLESEGIAIHAGAVVNNLERKGDGIEVTFTTAGRRTVAGSHLLVAVGRWPNVDGLDLNAAGIKHNASGLTVDNRLRTSNKKVYAVGDVAGGPRFTHTAEYHAGIVVKNALLGTNATVDTRIIPHVLLTDPELAQVGLTEADAAKQGGNTTILRWSYYDNDRAQLEGDTRGLIKVIVDKAGLVLGVTIIGRNAGEMITTWTLAITRGLNIRDMAELVVPYPTLGEIGKRAAQSYLFTGLTRSLPGRIIGALLRRG
jgi:pyruvate/2-oxoglutarate dehydrogenase complex dihydrolipoamide dehydrogenase (E3) component